MWIWIVEFLEFIVIKYISFLAFIWFLTVSWFFFVLVAWIYIFCFFFGVACERLIDVCVILKFVLRYVWIRKLVVYSLHWRNDDRHDKSLWLMIMEFYRLSIGWFVLVYILDFILLCNGQM
jgi:hypothetical protein